MATEAATLPDLGFLFSQLAHTLGTELTAELAELESTPRAHCVLNSALDRELTQSQLAERTALDKTTMVATIDQLERAGLAERRASSTDRRVRIIVVTPAGRRIVERAREIVQATYADVVASLPEDVREGFLRGLVALSEGRLAAPVACEHPPRRPRSA